MQENNGRIQEKEEKYIRILIEFTKQLNITPADLLKPDKSDIMCEIRHLYCKLRCENHNATFAAVGIEINRHCSTVAKGVRRINNLLFYEYERVVEMWELVKDIPEETDEKSSKADTNTFLLGATVGLLPISLKRKNYAIIFPLAP